MSGIKIITKNKRATHDYTIEETYEAGMQLQGTEVKSIRNNQVSLGEAFCTIDKNDEIWIQNMRIALYEFGTYANHSETRKRKLLLNKSEIVAIQKDLATKGLTLIPLKLYFKSSKVKLQIGLAKGKKLYDKRHDSKKKEVEKKLRQGNYE